MTLPRPALSAPDETVASMVSDPRIERFHTEPRCRVCRNEQVRKKVNDLLATGASYAMILRTLKDDNVTPDDRDCVTIDSIRRHASRHFPVQNVAKAVYREVLERRAMENGIDFVNGLATALTPMAYYEVIMNEAFRRLVDGGVDVSVDTGLRAAEKLQALVDARADQADIAGMRAEVGRIIEVFREEVPPERWPIVQAKLRGEEPIRRQEAPRVEAVRMVEISDESREDDN